ncbi:IS110 family transposase [Micromonospora chalcea]|uniref:IS110 family transposase n=1 Tax=Micromonospora TaxID=1873 RepID=UPI0033E6FB58
MASIASQSCVVIGGVDTHKDLHVAAVIDTSGQVLDTGSFSTTRAGYRALLKWLRSYGDVRLVGVEGTGSYGKGLTKHLLEAGVEVVEVCRPDRVDRRRRGKSDTIDAENAAHAALTGQRTHTPKSMAGKVEALRVLRSTRGSAVKSRRAALQRLHTLIVEAPAELRDQIRNMTRMQLLRTCAAWQPDTDAFRDPVTATRIAIKAVCQRILHLHDEIGLFDAQIAALVDEIVPELTQAVGIGREVAAQLLCTIGDNPERLRSEAAFAMLCGVAPLPASSGKTQRHRLNRGGDRAANSALHMAVISRIRVDQRTKDYIARRTTEGLSKLEIMRCLKRYLAREVYYLIRNSKLGASIV